MKMSHKLNRKIRRGYFFRRILDGFTDTAIAIVLAWLAIRLF